MARSELSNFEWNVILPLLHKKSRGKPRVDDRLVLNGIYWVLRAGVPWADLPERYGPLTTIYNRSNRLRMAGVGDRLTDAFTQAHEGDAQKRRDEILVWASSEAAYRPRSMQSSTSKVGQSSSGKLRARTPTSQARLR